MRVKDLIKSLQAYNPDLEVALLHGVGSNQMSLSGVNNVLTTAFQPDQGDEMTVVVIVDEATKVNKAEETKE